MQNKICGKEIEVEFDVEPDGKRINSTRNPHGQKSVYIPPGNYYLFLLFLYLPPDLQESDGGANT